MSDTNNEDTNEQATECNINEETSVAAKFGLNYGILNKIPYILEIDDERIKTQKDAEANPLKSSDDPFDIDQETKHLKGFLHSFKEIEIPMTTNYELLFYEHLIDNISISKQETTYFPRYIAENDENMTCSNSRLITEYQLDCKLINLWYIKNKHEINDYYNQIVGCCENILTKNQKYAETICENILEYVYPHNKENRYIYFQCTSNLYGKTPSKIYNLCQDTDIYGETERDIKFELIYKDKRTVFNKHFDYDKYIESLNDEGSIQLIGGLDTIPKRAFYEYLSTQKLYDDTKNNLKCFDGYRKNNNYDRYETIMKNRYYPIQLLSYYFIYPQIDNNQDERFNVYDNIFWRFMMGSLVFNEKTMWNQGIHRLKQYMRNISFTPDMLQAMGFNID